MKRLLVLSTAALVAACSAQRQETAAEEAAAVYSAAPSPESAAPPGAQTRAATSDAWPERTPPEAPPPRSGAPANPMLAYAYAYRLDLPSREVPSLLARHERACLEAGPARCQVVGATLDAPGEDSASGRLELRAERTWLSGFRTRLASESEAAGGRLTDFSTETEDLTRQTVDAEARLRALTTLAIRLEQLLVNRNGKLAELLEVERELARVQGEIDAVRSSLSTLRTRVVTEKLTVDYRPIGMIAPDGALAPVSDAVGAAARNAAGVVAGLITLLSVLAPVTPFGLVAWWLLRRRRKPTSAAG